MKMRNTGFLFFVIGLFSISFTLGNYFNQKVISSKINHNSQYITDFYSFSLEKLKYFKFQDLKIQRIDIQNKDLLVRISIRNENKKLVQQVIRIQNFQSNSPSMELEPQNMPNEIFVGHSQFTEIHLKGKLKKQAELSTANDFFQKRNNLGQVLLLKNLNKNDKLKVNFFQESMVFSVNKSSDLIYTAYIEINQKQPSLNLVDPELKIASKGLETLNIKLKE